VSLEQEIIARVIYLTVKIVPVIVIAIFFSNLLIEYGIIRKLDFLVRPLIRGANLPDGSGAVIVTSLASGTASYSMLANHHKKGEMDDTDVIVISFMNTFFQYTHHLITYWLPVAVPLLGPSTGFLYVSIKMSIALAVTLSSVVIGRIFIKNPKNKILSVEKDHTGESNSLKMHHAVRGTAKTVKMILPRLYIIYIAVVIFLATGYMESFGKLAEPLAHLFDLPGEAITILALQAFDATSGYVLTGALLQSETLNSFQAITALLLGTMITLSMTYAKHSLPSKIAFFGPRLGTKIAFYNLVLVLFFTLIALMTMVFFF
jgi:hypothetical protein